MTALYSSILQAMKDTHTGSTSYDSDKVVPAGLPFCNGHFHSEMKVLLVYFAFATCHQLAFSQSRPQGPAKGPFWFDNAWPPQTSWYQKQCCVGVLNGMPNNTKSCSTVQQSGTDLYTSPPLAARIQTCKSYEICIGISIRRFHVCERIFVNSFCRLLTNIWFPVTVCTGSCTSNKGNPNAPKLPHLTTAYYGGCYNASALAVKDIDQFPQIPAQGSRAPGRTFGVSLAMCPDDNNPSQAKALDSMYCTPQTYVCSDTDCYFTNIYSAAQDYYNWTGISYAPRTSHNVLLELLVVLISAYVLAF